MEKIKIVIGRKDGTSVCIEGDKNIFLERELGSTIAGKDFQESNEKEYIIRGANAENGKAYFAHIQGVELNRIFSRRGKGIHNIKRKKNRIARKYYGKIINSFVKSISLKEK